MSVSNTPFELLTASALYSAFLVIAAMFLLAKALNSKQRIYILLLYLGELGLLSFIYELLVKYIHRGNASFLGETGERLFLNTPFSAVVICEAFFTVTITVEWIALSKRVKNQVSALSVKKGIDSMPDGILLSSADGIPLLVNSSMYRLIHSAFDRTLSDVNQLEELYKNGEFCEGSHFVKVKDSTFVMLKDKTVWKIVKNELTFNKKKAYEILAYDTTSFYYNSVELEKRNRHLEEVNRRLREYSQNIDSVIREKEILAAKIRVHDDVGASLLALRSYIDNESIDRDRLYELWKYTVNVLKGRMSLSDNETTLESLIKAGEAVGVTLRFEGVLPENSRYTDVINHAIHECLTNTVQHADGTYLLIKTVNENGRCKIEFTNDGAPPDGEITEGGGLKHLRDDAERNGVKMTVESVPRFRLTLEF